MPGLRILCLLQELTICVPSRPAFRRIGRCTILHAVACRHRRASVKRGSGDVMLRRSSTVALAAGVLTLVVFSAGSPEPTSVALGLLCFLSGVTAFIGWEHVKRSI